MERRRLRGTGNSGMSKNVFSASQFVVVLLEKLLVKLVSTSLLKLASTMDPDATLGKKKEPDRPPHTNSHPGYQYEGSYNQYHQNYNTNDSFPGFGSR